MYNFYQSDLWRNINEIVYKKPTVYSEFFGEKHQGIIREKKLLGKTMRWIQFLGVNGLTDGQKDGMKKLLKPLHKKYKPIFIQLGITDIVENVSPENVENGIVIDNLIPKRAAIKEKLQKMGFRHSPKENLPPSTYIINTTISREKLRGKLSTTHKSKIKKAVANNVTCNIATTQAEYSDFFDILETTGKTKGFNTINKHQFIELCEWSVAQGNGFLYIAKQNNIIIGGSFYLMDSPAKAGIYLYGGTNREAGNIGVGQAVNWFAICDLQDRGVETIDLLGGGPIGDKNHPLYNVGLFKEGFGGEKIEFVGSYDIVYDHLFYLLRKLKNKK